MINEAKYRSPKWLRNFLDFEINTGEDITGEKSKKQILKEWDRRWREVDKDTFSKFYSVVFKSYTGRDIGSWIYSMSSREFSAIRSKWRGDMTLWEKFDKWLELEKRSEQDKREEKERKEKEQSRIKKELDNLWDRLVKDWNSAPYLDKIHTVTNQYTNNVRLTYTFESGDTIVMEDKEIQYGNITYTVGLIYRSQFVKGFNRMMEIGSRRPSDKSGPSKKKKAYTGKYSSHPKGRLYQTLLDTIRQREDNLKNMSKNDPERPALENELEAARRQVEKMKKKYKFENLTGFEDFTILK